MIRTYSNTKAELNVARIRLNELMTEKEVLYTKYFPMSSKTEEVSGHTNKRTDSFADYMAELTKVNKITGMSLDDEIQEQRNKVDRLDYCIRLMEYNLNNTTGIENDLFKLIIMEGRKKTKAVEIVAEKYNKEPVTIWKYHYPKISKEIDKCIVNV
jgi:hypothetical protein